MLYGFFSFSFNLGLDLIVLNGVRPVEVYEDLRLAVFSQKPPGSYLTTYFWPTPDLIVLGRCDSRSALSARCCGDLSCVLAHLEKGVVIYASTKSQLAHFARRALLLLHVGRKTF